MYYESPTPRKEGLGGSREAASSPKRGWQLVPHAVRDNISLLQYGARINQRGHKGLQCVPVGDTAMGALLATRVVNEDITIGMAKLGMT